jgi:hypothetical protein
VRRKEEEQQSKEESSVQEVSAEEKVLRMLEKTGWKMGEGNLVYSNI